MNAERILTIARDIRDSLWETDVNVYLTQLADALDVLSSNPADEATQQRLSNSRQELESALRSSPTMELPPVWVQQATELGLGKVLAPVLLSRVESILAGNSITPAVARDEMRTISQEVNQRIEELGLLIAGLERLEIRDDNLAPGEFEATVLVPRSHVGNSLDGLADEFEQVDKILKPFLELATGSRPPIEVRGISSSDFWLAVSLGAHAALYFSQAVETLVAAYERIIRVRQLREEIAEEGIEEALPAVTDHANGLMEREVAKLVDALIEQSGSDPAAPRTQELKIELTFSLNTVANEIDHGVSFEVNAGPDLPVAVESDGEEMPTGIDPSSLDTNAIRAKVVARQGNLRYANLTGKPILSLTTSEESAPDGPSDADV